MASRNSRRNFLGLLGAGASGALLAAGTARGGEEPKAGDEPGQGKYKGKGKPFKGTSKKGVLQDALDEAIKAAQDSATGADRMVVWTLYEVSGREGGVAGFNEVTVTIDATIN